MTPYSRTEPYNQLPKMPPAAELETKSVLKLTIQARAALEGLKYAGRLIPNQGLLVQALVMQEARSSSEIENIVTTNDDLYRSMGQADETADPQVKEVLRYSKALWQGHSRGEISTVDVPELAAAILDHQVEFRNRPGTRIGNPSTGEIIYTPPVGAERIRDLLDNVLGFVRDAGPVDPVVRIAAAHYQFEAIHPFLDGNGRTGRILNILWMCQLGLLEVPVLYMSRAIIESRTEYYQRLRAVTERQDWNGWIEYFVDVVHITALETRRRIEHLQRMIHEAKLEIREKLPKIYSAELVELVFSQPYIRIENVVAAGLVKRQAASLYLQQLEGIGVLRQRKLWRETLYVNDALMTALTV